MASDNFDIVNLQSSLEALKGMNSESASIGSNMSDINVILANATEAHKNISDYNRTDFETIQNIEDVLTNVENELKRVGVEAKKIADIRKGELETIKKQSKEIENLKNKEISAAKAVAKAKEKSSKEGSREQKLEEIRTRKKKQGEDKYISENTGINRVAKSIDEQTKSLRGYFSQITGIQLSIGWLISMILKATQESKEFAASGQQIAANWSDITKKGGMILRHSGDMAAMTRDLSREWGKSNQEAATMLNNLARAGMSYEEIETYNRDIFSIEVLQGVSAAAQVKTWGDITNNLGVTRESAMGYKDEIILISKRLRDTGGVVASTEELVGLMNELGNKTAGFNNDLLGSVSLFNTLASKKFNMGGGKIEKMPLDVAKAVSTAMAGMGELDEGLQAALMEGPGTAVEKIMKFRDMKTIDQFKLLNKFVTSKLHGSDADKRFQAIKLYEMLGLDKKSSNVMAKMAAAGEDYNKLAEVMEADRKLAETEKLSATQILKKQQALAASISQAAMDFQTKLEQIIRDKISMIIKFQDVQNLFDKVAELVTLLARLLGANDKSPKRIQEEMVEKLKTAPAEKRAEIIFNSIAKMNAAAAPNTNARMLAGGIGGGAILGPAGAAGGAFIGALSSWFTSEGPNRREINELLSELIGNSPIVLATLRGLPKNIAKNIKSKSKTAQAIGTVDLAMAGLDVDTAMEFASTLSKISSQEKSLDDVKVRSYIRKMINTGLERMLQEGRYSPFPTSTKELSGSGATDPTRGSGR